MKLNVRNFGPIREAKNIDVSPMTVFVGPSNTGKSYLAILIYTIMQALGDESARMLMLWVNAAHLNVDDHDAAVAKLVKTWEAYRTKENMLQKIDEVFHSWLEMLGGTWKEQINRCFGEQGKKMMAADNLSIKISDDHKNITLDLSSLANNKLSHRQKKEFLNKLLKFEFFAMQLEKLQATDFDGDLATFKKIEVDFAAFLYSQFYSMLFPQKNEGEGEIEYKRTNSHYLPAIRGGIMQSHRTLVNAVIEQAPLIGLSEKIYSPAFGGVLSDFIKKLINLDGKDKTDEISKIGEAIEHKIMHGEINVEKSESKYPDFRYAFHRENKEHDLSITNASSMVSELAPVSLFIRHCVRKGDLFILEEPEAHLHPGAQRDISNILVQLVNAGVQVLITTHSSDILEQISNYVYAAEVDDKIENQSLDKEKLSAYLFNRSYRSKNTVVKKVQFDADMGILPKDHLEVSSALYNETAGLFEKRDKQR